MCGDKKEAGQCGSDIKGYTTSSIVTFEIDLAVEVLEFNDILGM